MLIQWVLQARVWSIHMLSILAHLILKYSVGGVLLLELFKDEETKAQRV